MTSRSHTGRRLAAGVLVISFACSGADAQWIQTNGPGSAKIRCFTVGRSGTYAGTDRGGVYFSSDHGNGWQMRRNGLVTNPIDDVRSLASSGDTVWVGLISRGIYRSTDGGILWQATSMGISPMVSSLALSGRWVLEVQPEVGIRRSSDDGKTWSASVSGLPGTTPYCVLAHGPRILVGTQTGMYVSTDTGGTWLASAGIDASNPIYSIADEGTSLVAGGVGSVYTSNDDGYSWTRASGVQGSVQFSSIVFHGSTVIAASNVDGVFRSTDDGKSWISINAGLPLYNIYALALDSSVLYTGTQQGAFTSTNVGDVWVSANKGMATSITGVFVSQGQYLLATTTTALDGVVFRTSDNGDTWIPIARQYPVHAPIISAGPLLYAAGGGGVYMSADTGISWTASSNQGLFPTEPWSFAAQGSIVYASAPANGVCRTTNNGYTWRVARDGLSNFNVLTLSSDGPELYAGAHLGDSFFRSLDSAQLWEPRINGLGETSVRAIAAMSQTLIAGTWSGIYRSVDDGSSWRLLDQGVASNLTNVRTLVSTDSVVLAGDLGDNGVAASFDRGASWTLVNEGLPDKSITVLCIHGNNVFAGTWNSGAWRRPLSEIMVLGASPPPPPERPSSYALGQNYPNPFNARTTIEFSLPEPGSVTLCVYDILGKKVTTLIEGQKPADRYSVAFDGAGLASGVYIYRLSAGAFVNTKRMVLVK